MRCPLRFRCAPSVTLLLLFTLVAAPARAQSPAPAAPAEPPTEAPATEPAAEPAAASPESDADERRLQLEIERARAEAERARAEAERLRLERARVEAGEAPDEDESALPGYHEHDGFFLRLAIGPGFGGYTGDGVATVAGGAFAFRDPSERGLSLAFPFAIGAAVAPDLILHAQLRVDSPPLNTNDVRLEVSTAVVGPGVTRYFQPHNLFVTVAAGAAFTWYRLVFGAEDDDVRPDPYDSEVAFGAGVEAMVGKEWWVSANWGLGMALNATYSYTANDDVAFHGYGTKLLFTATYN